MANEAVAGWYGKLPMLGDFAHRRLPQAFIRVCDDWLAACIAESRRTLGADWLDRYLNAPLWCFAWAPKVVDDSWWFGVMMPSVDAVGRYFPLVIALASPGIPNRKGLERLAQWLDHASDCAVGVLADGATVEAFDDDLQTPWVDLLPTAETPAFGVGDAEHWTVNAHPARIPEDFANLALHALRPHLNGRTIWWQRSVPDRSSRAITMHLGLPPPGRFAAMLGGSADSP
jgi:type VI secretion system protein ImpM